MNTHASSDTLLQVWFGDPEQPLAVSAQWFKKNEEFDRRLREQFEATLDAGVRGELESWTASPRGRLALVILFDQFSRNIFRGTARSFAQDHLAQKLAVEALAKNEEQSLTPVERYFLLMPLMHAENVEYQRRCVGEFERLVAETPEPKAIHDLVATALDYAKRHAVIVERFGRFPHRNAMLGRESTPEETEFLKEPGSSF